MNSHQLKNKKPIAPPEKELSKREKMAEFANNVPKPRQRKASQSGVSESVSQQIRSHDQSQYNDYESVSQAPLADNSTYGGNQVNYNSTPNNVVSDQQSNSQYQYNQYGGIGSTGENVGVDPATINQLAQKHDMYADEISKIKAMLDDQ